MQFLRLKLSNWRNFSDVDISLASRMFLVGPNASGKSNLLDVFRFLRDIVKAGGGLKKAVMDRGGVSGLRCLAARRYPDIKVEVNVGEPSEPEDCPLWRYRIEFNQDNRRNPIIKSEQLWKKGKKIVNRPNEEDKKDPQRLTQTYLEQVNMNQQFRDLVHFFESVQYLHLVPHLIREPERFMGKSGDPFGGDFLERLASTPEKTRGARLRKINEALHIAVPQFGALELERDTRGTPHLKALYEHWRRHGAWQNEKLFSDGTLRLLGFLWSLLDGEGPLLLEEPELSLHPGVVRCLARLIARIRRKRKRQVLISTHSSDLVADKGIGGEEVLVLNTTDKGTEAKVGKDVREIWVLLESGISVSEAILPRTEPKDLQQLELFEG
jgi:predicted ATPase